MKKNILILLAMLASSQILYSSGNHDSLLFDGENILRTETYYSKPGEECEFRITYVKGTATGLIRKTSIYEVCGQTDTTWEYVNGDLKRNTVVKPGEKIKTGPQSTARVELPDGSVIVLGPNSDYTLPSNTCEITKTSFLTKGSLWSRVKKLIGGGKFEVSTHGMGVGVRGTEFTVEVIEENGVNYTVTKVFEGSVEVNLKSVDTKDYEEKLDKQAELTEEWQAGKITMEEYTARSIELANVLMDESKKLKVSQLVEAGYFLRTDGKSLGDPVPFNTSEDTWFIINE